MAALGTGHSSWASQAWVHGSHKHDVPSAPLPEDKSVYEGCEHTLSLISSKHSQGPTQPFVGAEEAAQSGSGQVFASSHPEGPSSRKLLLPAQSLARLG